MSAFRHDPHPWRHQRAQAGPVKVADQGKQGSAFARFNSAAALRITAVVGTMVCGYVFVLLALYGLPTAVKAGPSGIVLWTSSEFLQLCLLPVIIVGQNLQARAADARAEATYNDAEAVLHECTQLQEHLAVQDGVLERLIAAETSRTEAAARSLSAPAEVLAPAKGTTAAKVAAAKAAGPKLQAPGKERM